MPLPMEEIQRALAQAGAGKALASTAGHPLLGGMEGAAKALAPKRQAAELFHGAVAPPPASMFLPPSGAASSAAKGTAEAAPALFEQHSKPFMGNIARGAAESPGKAPTMLQPPVAEISTQYKGPAPLQLGKAAPAPAPAAAAAPAAQATGGVGSGYYKFDPVEAERILKEHAGLLKGNMHPSNIRWAEKFAPPPTPTVRVPKGGQ